MILVVLVLLLVIFPFGLLLLEYISNINLFKIKNRQKRKPDKILKNKTDLFYLHQVSKVWVGMIVELEDTKSKYILTSVDFDSTDSWDLWKPYTDLNKLYIEPNIKVTLHKANNTPYVLDKNHLLIISNDDEFDNKNVRKGSIISLNIARVPEVGDIVIDVDLVLWQVKSINDCDIYTLVKKDNYKKEKLVNIYAVGESLWQIN